MKIVIMSGIPGSGKTTLAKQLYPDASVCSADDYFRTPCTLCMGRIKPNLACALCHGTFEFYDFRPEEPSHLAEAHQRCLRSFVELLRHSNDQFRTVVIDNTNTSAVEIAPYAALGQAFNHEVQVLTLECPVEVAMARQVHGVPVQTLARMFEQLRARILPSWWKQTTISVSR